MTSGYEFSIDGDDELLHIEGTLIRSIQPSEFSVDIVINNSTDEILLFNYLK